MSNDITAALQPTACVDSTHPEIIRFAKDVVGNETDPRQQAVKLYYAVRDRFRYDPYAIDLTPNGMKASTALAVGHGWCVTKAVLLAAACRAVGIPARLGFADVRNHLSTERMRKTMQTDIFYWHGYTAIHLDGQWLKATPAFNIELCQRFALQPLEFDGTADSIYHPFDLSGNRHMEYINFRGEMEDVPLAEMFADFTRLYPHMPRVDKPGFDDASFDADVAKEMRQK